MRNTFNKTGFGFFVAALSVAALAVQDGVSLKRAAKVGDTVTFRLKADVEIGGMEANFTAKVVEKVAKVETNGNFTIDSTQSEGKIVFGGQEMEAPEQSQTFTYKATGEVVDIKAENTDSTVWRMANLQSFVVVDKALKVGDEWTTEGKKDEKTGAVATKGTYKIEGTETIGKYECLKVKFSIKETEGGDTAASAEGISWVNKKDGTLAKFEGKWINAPFPGAPGPINAKIVMTREG